MHTHAHTDTHIHEYTIPPVCAHGGGDRSVSEHNVLLTNREINKGKNVILFNKLEADLVFYHLRQAVQEGYSTEVRFFLTCHVEI